jgi:putative flippase GtrA
MTRARLALLYGGFAAIATAANLGAQWLVLRPAQTEIRELAALAVGTVIGMPIKYVLDKRYIFASRAQTWRHDLRMFLLYVGTAVVTTGVFWGSELTVASITESRSALLSGGAVGLAAGYALKYRLDKQLVFSTTGPTS